MDLNEDKQAAAQAALAEVHAGMHVGLGTGSTAEVFVRLLALRVREGLSIRAVATSAATYRLAEELGMTVLDASQVARLDLAVDGADRIGPGLALVKGAGGALLYEKIVASQAERFVVIADGSKLGATLEGTPLPVEIVPFATAWVLRRIRDLGGTGVLRLGAGGQPLVTDAGHHLLDCTLDLRDPQAVARALRDIPGVVEHGLFLQLAHVAYVSDAGRVRRLEP
jgi:ribose 5-phosphate isomerase A